MRTTRIGAVTGSVSTTTKQQINAKIEVMVAAGQTDGLSSDSIVDNMSYWERNWTTLADAQEWIDFSATWDTPPVTAEILPI
jgi:hypothetical protein